MQKRLKIVSKAVRIKEKNLATLFSNKILSFIIRTPTGNRTQI